MNKLKPIILEHIGRFSILVGLLGIGAHLLSARFDISWLQALVIAHFQDPTGLMPNLFDGPGVYLNWLTTFFLLLTVIGGLIYQRTSRNDSRLLRFAWSIVTIKGIMILVSTPFRYRQFQRLIKNNPDIKGDIPTTFDFIWPLFYILPIAVFAYVVVKWLQSQKHVLYTEKVRESGLVVRTIPMVSKWKRFWHFVFDYILMFFVTWPFIQILIAVDKPILFGFSQAETTQGLYLYSVLIIGGLTLYYLLFEGLFKTTPIKFLTGTRVVVEDTDTPPAFGRIIGRTLSRHIPLEAFSFFGHQGWHDSISGTMVVSEDDKGASMKYHAWWAVAFFLLYFGLFSYGKIERVINEDRRSQFNTESTIAKRLSDIQLLNAGDVLTFKRANANWSEPHSMLYVISTNDKTISASRSFYASSSSTDRRTMRDTLSQRGIPIDTVTIQKDNLENSITNRGRNSVSFSDGGQYELKNIYDLDHPEFIRGSSSWKYNDGDPFRIYRMSHDLMPIEILDIKTMTGKASWIDTFPIRSTFDERSQIGVFEIQLGKFSKTRPYKAECTIRYQGDEHTYIIEGLDSRFVLYRKAF